MESRRLLVRCTWAFANAYLWLCFHGFNVQPPGLPIPLNGYYEKAQNESVPEYASLQLILNPLSNENEKTWFAAD